MEPSYSVVADALSKFHMSLPWIQALWLTSVSGTLVGIAWCLGRTVERIVTALVQRREDRRGRPVAYALYRAPDGRWMLYAGGSVHELTDEEMRERRLLPGLPAAKAELR